MKINKNGIVIVNNINEYHYEPDGTIWQQIFFHADPTSNKFKSSDDFTNGVFYNSSMWLDAKIFNELISWEILWIQKNYSNVVSKFRWTQSYNPFTATYENVAPGQVTYNTTVGYSSSSYGGLYKLNSSTFFCVANGTKGNWFGAVGAWNSHDGGIPGHPSGGTIRDGGWVSVYVRISENKRVFKDVKQIDEIIANHFIEI